MEMPTPKIIPVYNVLECLDYVKTQYEETYKNFQGENYRILYNYVVYCFSNLCSGAYAFTLKDVDYLTTQISQTEDMAVQKMFLIFQEFIQCIIDDLGEGGLIYISLELYNDKTV